MMRLPTSRLELISLFRLIAAAAALTAVPAFQPPLSPTSSGLAAQTNASSAPEPGALPPDDKVAYLGSPEDLLQLELDRTLRGAVGPRATVGAEVRSLTRDEVLYSLNAERLLQPASNVKLFTVAAALHHLGPSFTYRTTVYATGPVEPGGRLRGDLVLEGRGDPNLSGRFYGDSVMHVFDRLAEALAAQGIKTVTGDLVGDNSYFAGPEMGEGWPWDTQQWWYSAQIDALSFNDNSITITAMPGPRVGSPARIRKIPDTSYVAVRNEARTVGGRSGGGISVHRNPESNVVEVGGEVPLSGSGASVSIAVDDPARFALSVFRERLLRGGIEVEGETRLVEAEFDLTNKGRWTALATHVSPPLSETVKVVNKRSQNFYAEQLLKTLGAEVEGEGSTTAGIAAVDVFLRDEVGLEPGTIYMADGSGLSRLNLVTPRAVVQLLAAMARHPHSREFYDSLGVPGEDAWSDRLDEPLTRGNVHAKTGTVRYVSAYSGYLTAGNGELLAFSILVNNRPDGKASAVLIENAVVRALARFKR